MQSEIERVAVSRKEAIKFLQTAMRNWRIVRFNEAELEDMRAALEDFASNAVRVRSILEADHG